MTTTQRDETNLEFIQAAGTALNLAKEALDKQAAGQQARGPLIKAAEDAMVKFRHIDGDEPTLLNARAKLASHEECLKIIARLADPANRTDPPALGTNDKQAAANGAPANGAARGGTHPGSPEHQRKEAVHQRFRDILRRGR